MTRKDADPDFYNPTEDQLQAFENLKKCIIALPILALLQYGRPYMIETDASAYQLGCTLLQEHDKLNDWRPGGYWSYSLTNSERNCSTTECECFAVVWAVRTLRPYVEGTKVTVRMDYDALKWLMSLTESSGRLAWWRLRLAEYDFTIQYPPDACTRYPTTCHASSRRGSPTTLAQPSRRKTTFAPSTRTPSFETPRTRSWATFAPRAATKRSNTSLRRRITKPAHGEGRAPERATNRGEMATPSLYKDPTRFGRRMTNSTPPTSSELPAPRRACTTRRSPLRRTTFRLLFR